MGLKYLLVVVLCFSSFIFAKEPPIAINLGGDGVHEDDIALRYILLGSSVYKVTAKFSCEIAVLVDYYKSTLKLVRLGDRTKRLNVNTFRNSPRAYGDYGQEWELNSLFPDIDLIELVSVEVLFKFEDKEKKLMIIAHLVDGSTSHAFRDIGMYYSDKPKNCLK